MAEEKDRGLVDLVLGVVEGRGNVGDLVDRREAIVREFPQLASALDRHAAGAMSQSAWEFRVVRIGGQVLKSLNVDARESPGWWLRCLRDATVIAVGGAVVPTAACAAVIACHIALVYRFALLAEMLGSTAERFIWLHLSSTAVALVFCARQLIASGMTEPILSGEAPIRNREGEACGVRSNRLALCAKTLGSIVVVYYCAVKIFDCSLSSLPNGVALGFPWKFLSSPQGILGQWRLNVVALFADLFFIQSVLEIFPVVLSVRRVVLRAEGIGC